MEKLNLPNIVLTQGETSDIYEIYSKESLKDYTAEYRVTNADGVALQTKTLEHTKEVKNQDNIFNDNLVYTLSGKEFEILNGINEFNTAEKPFTHKISLETITKDKLKEELSLEGLVYDEEYVDTVKNKADLTEDEKQYVVEGSDKEQNGNTTVILHKLVKKPVQNVEVTITFSSTDKEISRTAVANSGVDGKFTAKLFLGSTIKQEAGVGFEFIITEDISKALQKGRYLLTLTVSKKNTLDEIIFSKEIIQTKLDINEKL